LTSIILYHDNCFDGTASAYVAKMFLSDPKVFIGCKYGDPLPALDQFSGNDVYLLDFSFPREFMLEIKKTAKSFKVLDHHKTAQAACEGLDFCTFDMERSGAGLTWDYLVGSAKRPKLINYIEDRDLWRFKLPFSHEISAFIASYQHDLSVYQWLHNELETNFAYCVSEGAGILRYENQKIEEIARESRFTTIAGHSVPTVNVPYLFGSSVCHLLCELYPAAPFAAYYFTAKDGTTKFGLRGRDSDDFDVSEVAKQFGGGGHKKAAGFVSTGTTTTF